jgi:hypothetical protein
MNTKLKPYMVYNRHEDPSDGAVLVFHFTARQARYMGWQAEPLMDCDSYIDATARLIRDPKDVYPLTQVQWLEGNLPHAIVSPEVCRSCGFWGSGVDENGRCNDCGEYAGDALFELFQQWREKCLS